MMKLSIKIAHNERGGYTAWCPTLPGCKTQGQTREEAQERIGEAIRGYIAAMSNFVPENVQHEVIET
jgi:predicted RNase H-like HicB family nuclease